MFTNNREVLHVIFPYFGTQHVLCHRTRIDRLVELFYFTIEIDKLEGRHSQSAHSRTIMGGVSRGKTKQLCLQHLPYIMHLRPESSFNLVSSTVKCYSETCIEQCLFCD